MKRKIEINKSELAFIVAALMAYDASGVAEVITNRFEDADPANDGPEVELLRRKEICYAQEIYNRRNGNI